MKSGIFFAGLIILAIGAIGWFYYNTIYQNLSTMLNQLARLLNPQLQQQYQFTQIYMMSSIFLIILGFGLLVYGAVASKPPRLLQTDNVTQTKFTQNGPQESNKIMIRCLNCNTLNPEDAEYCNKCGKELRK